MTLLCEFFRVFRVFRGSLLFHLQRLELIANENPLTRKAPLVNVERITRTVVPGALPGMRCCANNLLAIVPGLDDLDEPGNRLGVSVLTGDLGVVSLHGIVSFPTRS